MLKKIIILSFALTASFSHLALSQTCNLDWDVSLYGAGASGKSLPFWAVTNKNGIFPNSHSGFVVAGTDFKYASKPGIDVYAGFKFSGAVTPSVLAGVSAAPEIRWENRSLPGQSVWKGMIEEAYAGIGWKMLRLDLGMIDREYDYGGLSLTGGNIVWSGNSRNIPGYNFQVKYFEVPGTKGIFSIKANYADYKLFDDRYVDRAMLHNKSLFFKFRLHRRVHFQIGLEQWSLWGGISPTLGRQPDSFNDYLRVVCGMSGGSDASESDQINALGDHRGREKVMIDWAADKFTLSLAYDKPFEDGSGTRFQNLPDGVYTLFCSFNDKDRWVSDLLYEFVYTKWQSGPYHDTSQDPDRKDEEFQILGGRDNYFNNGEYKSGWTYFGRTIGLPLITPKPVNEDGIVLGVCNNRVVAHHFGMAGKFARKVPYRFKATYSKNYGLYTQSIKELFEQAPEQLSLALEVDFPRFAEKLPLAVSVGVYGDVGELYQNNFGLTLRLSYGGSWKTVK